MSKNVKNNEKRVTLKLPKLYKWQKDFIDMVISDGRGSHYIYTLKSSRQKGKSFTLTSLILYYSFNYVGTSVIVSPTLSQSRKLFDDISKLMRGIGIDKSNETLLQLKFHNGSQILFKSGEQKDNLRGFTVTNLLLIDEGAYITDDVYDILLPLCDVHKAQIVVASTPRMRQGRFYEYWNAGLDPSRKRFKSFTYEDYDTTEVLDEDTLNEYKRMLPKNQFMTEYLGEFVDDGGGVFTDYEDCFYISYDFFNKLTPPKLYVGIDWGSGQDNDYTAISVMDSNAEQYKLLYFNDLSTTEQIDYIVDELEKLEKMHTLIQSIYSETNGLGKPMTDLLKKTLKDRNLTKLLNVVKEFTTTNSTKKESVSDLQVRFENKNIKLLSDNKLRTELNVYKMTFNPKTQTVTYNAEKGFHDDTVMATMLSLKALKDSTTTTNGSYSLSFKNNNNKNKNKNKNKR